MANAMRDDLEEAGRHLQMVDGHLSEESMEHGEIAMTQVPVMFGDTEMEMEMETQIPEEEEDDGILVSTQVQAQIDELDEQAHVMKSFRNVLSKFALETQQGLGPGPEPERELEREIEPSVSVSPKKRPTKKIVKPVKKKAAPRVQKRIKSITQFNTDKWEDIRAHDRAQKMISMLSGKSAKVKKLVSKLNCDVAADAGADQTDTDSQFAPFNESEWQHIIALLREKLPKVSRKEISSVQSYVYGKSQGLWEASQMSPEKQEQEENQEYFGTGPESAAAAAAAPAAGMVQDDHRLSVYTLSQLVEGHSSSSNNNNNSGSANQNSSDDSIQHIQNVPDVSCIDVPSSETGYASQVADSCDTGSIISLDRRSLCMGSDWEAEAESETEAEIAIEIDIDIGEEKVKEKQMKAPFRTQSYDVVSSIVSPMKSTRMPSIQVPATRTTTFQDQNLVQTQTQLQAQNSAQAPSLKHLHTVKLIVDSNTDANEILSSVGPMSNESDQHDSLSTVTTSMLHRDNEIIIGSEEEKDSN